MVGGLSFLKLLSDGEIHSGEELSLLAGVSRTAVWKQLKKLQGTTGLRLESIRGRGYQLRGGIELLDRELVLSKLKPEVKGRLSELGVYDRVDSTNSLALQRAQAGDAGGYVAVAEQQLTGRGRRGRSWVSPYGCNLYCSVVWQFQSGAAALEGLSLAVGVAVARALTSVGVESIGVKWPNDIVWNGRKLAGILLEMIGDVAGHCQVVIGIGINVAMADSSVGLLIGQPWTDVSTAVGTKISRNMLLAGLLSELVPVLEAFEVGGFAAFRSSWTEMDIMLGRSVVVQLGGRTVIGDAAGVSDSGALAIDTALGREWFHGGEVSLRLQN